MSGNSLYWEFDDRNPAFTYGPGWLNLTDTNAYGSTLSYTSKKTNVTIRFYGTRHSQRHPLLDTDQAHRAPPRKDYLAFWCHRKNRRLESARFPLHSRRSIHLYRYRRDQKQHLVQRTARVLLQPRFIQPHTHRRKRQGRRDALLGLLPRRTNTAG